MDDIAVSNFQKINQPEPSFSDSNKPENTASAKKTYNFPDVGVLETPYISNTPIMDTFVKKRNENPQIKYKEVFKKVRFFNLQNVLSTAIVAVSGISLASVIKSAIKHFKK